MTRTRPGFFAPLPTGYFRHPKTKRARAVDADAPEGFLVLVAEQAAAERGGGETGHLKMAWDDFANLLGVPVDEARFGKMFAAFQLLGWIDLQDSDEFGFHVVLPNASEWNGDGGVKQARHTAAKEAEAKALVAGDASGRFSPEHLALSRLLANLILKRDPKARVQPESTRWLDSCRLLMEKDGRSAVEIEHVIKWCQKDTFWAPNILSMPKLREKFDMLIAKAGKPRDTSADSERWGVE